jgi:hypothetical protein
VSAFRLSLLCRAEVKLYVLRNLHGGARLQRARREGCAMCDVRSWCRRQRAAGLAVALARFVSFPSKRTSPESDAIKDVIKQRHPRNGARGGALVDWGRLRAVAVAALLRRHRSKGPATEEEAALLQDAESRRPDEKHFPLVRCRATFHAPCREV